MESKNIHVIRDRQGLPEWIDVDRLVAFIHESTRPYEDRHEDIARAIETCLEGPLPGGFILLAETGTYRPAGALVMLKTGMSGYVPPNLLLFIGVDPACRGRGIGQALIEKAAALCEGNIKLHVEYENPAKRLYERLGFRSKYAEMRFVR